MMITMLKKLKKNKGLIKKILNFNDYKNCLFNNKIILKT